MRLSGGALPAYTTAPDGGAGIRMETASVGDARVGRRLAMMYTGAGLLFLVNIFLGFGNVGLDPGIPRAQILTHLHSGTIGWISLSVITTMLWVFADARRSAPGYARSVATLGLIAFIAFAGYIASFALGFSQGGAFYALLPVFGGTSALVLWSAAIFAATQLRRQPVVTTVHVLLVSSLFVGAVGATVGVLLGLEYVLGRAIVPAPIDRVGPHAGVMDPYLFLAFAGVVEFLVRPDPAARRRWPGLLQAGLWIASAAAILIGLLAGIEALAGLTSLLLLVGLIVYLVRIGWRTFTVNPFRSGRAPALFWGGFWFPAYLLMFIAAIPLFIAGRVPTWLYVVLAHTFFVGMATNLLLATISTYTGPPRPTRARLEAAAAWLINLGMILFLVVEMAYDRAEGALLMGAGVVLGVMAVLWALAHHPTGPAAPAERVHAPKGRRNA